MAPHASAPPLQTYLVEHYLPGLGVEELEQLAGRASRAVGELQRQGRPVRSCARSSSPATSRS